MKQTTYTLPDNILQATVQLLNQLPAAQSRHLLNAIEAECKRQDDERAAKADADKRTAILAEAQSNADHPA
jgi:hypothetical protein